MISQYLFGFAAGGMSLLAPCVLPLLPLIVTGSLKNSKWGPLLSALGLTLSFTFFGILTNVFSSVFDPNSIRKMGAVLLIVVSSMFLLPSFKSLFANQLQKVSDFGIKLQTKVKMENPISEFLGGFLLGMIWSPCTGPTLALAVGLASQSENLFHATLVFLFFGLGAGLGMLCFGFLIRSFKQFREKLFVFGGFLNFLAGVFSLIVGLLILSDTDVLVEEFVLNKMPNWLINFSVMF